MRSSRLLGRLGPFMLLLALEAGHAECVISPGFEELNTAVKGFAVPATSPVQGVERVGTAWVRSNAEEPGYVFIDVRPPSFFAACRLRGSRNLEYTFAGAAGDQVYQSDNRLTREVVQQLLDGEKTVVLFCNNAFGERGCHRAVNAAITAVCDWNLPAERIKWFAEGVSGAAVSGLDVVEGPRCRPPWH